MLVIAMNNRLFLTDLSTKALRYVRQSLLYDTIAAIRLVA
jgi:hypothetical protein